MLLIRRTHLFFYDSLFVIFSEEYDFGLNHEVCAVQLIKDLLNVTPEEMSRVVLACKYYVPCVLLCTNSSYVRTT